ncbi:hypothetical protein [Colwellia sp. 12G3]|uniref:hypothetical protein n=1 Tax=Colwellia sp. 12G3 TaxID=2058299 RepID=UPI000C323432|nr:hypothetical protein [Colwellia sp. 12G3]PKI15934.1 hypothetical protein CXF71_11905 [Colwellia sp. 12G3]
MNSATIEKYQGYYKIVKEPRSLKTHNSASWVKIVKLLNGKEKASFDELTLTVKGHLHNGDIPDNEYRFIIYCIKSNWLGAV